jgi:hypothetical protein
MIAPTELTQNYKRINTPYDPNQPIETLSQQIQDARSFSVAGGQPYGNVMIINFAYTLIFNTGLFTDVCRAWKPRVVSEKTWSQSKINLSTSYREFRLTNQTAQQSGFHSASMMIEKGHSESIQDNDDAIAQLETAAASDRGTVATLTTTNAILATQLEADHALISQLNNEIATLKNKIKPAWQGQRPVKTITTDIAGGMVTKWRNHT